MRREQRERLRALVDRARRDGVKLPPALESVRRRAREAELKAERAELEQGEQAP